MPAPKTPEEQILSAIKDLGDRQSKLEIMMHEMVSAQMENATLIEALIEAIGKAPQVLLGGVEIDPPADLDLNTWIEDQKRKD